MARVDRWMGKREAGVGVGTLVWGVGKLLGAAAQADVALRESR